MIPAGCVHALCWSVLNDQTPGTRAGEASTSPLITRKDAMAMAVQFRDARVDFPPTTGTPQHKRVSVDFGTGARVLRAEAALKGFSNEFTENDRSFFRQRIIITNVRVSGHKVEVEVEFLLRDKSGVIDDPFAGAVQILVIAVVD
jgi:hypothetical protein